MSRIRAFRWTLAAALALALLGASAASALSLQKVGSGFEEPIYVTSVPGNPGRLLVVERRGTIEALEGGVATPFADLSSEVSCCEGEGGLQSIALAPDFATTGRFYVDYTGTKEPGEIHVAEMQAIGSTAPIGTLRNLLTIPHPTEKNHIGGQLQIGPDGNLYISTGDGGGGDDQFQNAQDPKKLLGKILRIHPNPSALVPPFYTVPAGNPFPSASAPADTVWAYGLRNPYRFSFDRLSGDMVIGDVGQSAREEIDFAASPFPGIVGGAGVNYGWNCREGFLAGPDTDPQCATTPASSFTDPVFDYPHNPDPDVPGSSDRCAIIGGYVVHDPALGALDGNYVYSDLCSGELRSLRLPEGSDGRGGRGGGDCSLGLALDRPVSFGQGADGSIYVAEQGGSIFRLTGSPPASCPVQTPPPAQSTTTAVQLKPTAIGIKAQRRRVERGKAALLTVYVSPCEGRKGDPIELVRNGHSNGTKYLSRACTARFLPRIHSGTTFSAVTHANRAFVAGKSRKLTIRIARPHKRHR